MLQQKKSRGRRPSWFIQREVIRFLTEAGGKARWRDLLKRAEQEKMTGMTLKRTLDKLIRKGIVLPTVGEINGKPARIYALTDELLPRQFVEDYGKIQEKVRQVCNVLSARNISRSRKARVLTNFLKTLLEVYNKALINIVKQCSQISDEKLAGDKFFSLLQLLEMLTVDQIFAICVGYPEIGLEVCSHLLEELQQVKERRVRGAMTQVPKRKGGDVK